MISKRFVKATSKSSIIECYSTLANLERTWAKVEVITLLGNLPDSQVVGKTTIGELKMINESKGINAVYEKMISDSRELANSTRLYFDDDGKLVGASNYRTSYKNNANFDINVYEYDNAIVHFGEDGKIVGISTDNSCYSGYSKFDERLRIVSKYLSEEDMIDKYHNYNLKSGLKK